MMANPHPSTPKPVSVTIEAIAWVTQFVGGNETRRTLLAESVPAGTTVRQVLRQVSGRFPKLHDVLWDKASGSLAEHIEIFVNDAVLGLKHELDSPLQDGDRITLAGQYTGG